MRPRIKKEGVATKVQRVATSHNYKESHNMFMTLWGREELTNPVKTGKKFTFVFGKKVCIAKGEERMYEGFTIFSE